MATLDIGETASFRSRLPDGRHAGPVADSERREAANSDRGDPMLNRSYRLGSPPRIRTHGLHYVVIDSPVRRLTKPVLTSNHRMETCYG